ncbi:MAG: neutral ceramidase [Verrucomicrobiales bacterium]|jgi:neutral ceramidase
MKHASIATQITQTLLALIALGTAPTFAAEPSLETGSAIEKITPPLGVPMAGYYHERGATGVHDDLYARAIVLQSNGTKAALVSLDLISTRRSFIEKARQLIEKETGIPSSHIMISATHTHTAPVLADANKPDDSDGANASPAEAYLMRLPAQIAACVRTANDRLKPVEALAATGSEDAITFNRRFHMRDGSVGWNPGKMNKNIVKPAGPIDSGLPMVLFRELESRAAQSVYVNYSVHLDNVGGTDISADLPYTVTENLRSAWGKNLVTVYTSGACGDLNHVDVSWPEPQKGHGNAARMGTILAAEVLRSQRRLASVQGLLQVGNATVSLAIPTFTEAAINQSKEIVRTGNDRNRASFMRLVHAHKVLDIAARDGKPLEVEVQVITLGKTLAWVALPGEVFTELGLQLKADSPFAQTMIAELANGSIGYVPSRRSFRQGNYEVVSARCLPGAGEKLVRTALDLLQKCAASAQANDARD